MIPQIQIMKANPTKRLWKLLNVPMNKLVYCFRRNDRSNRMQAPVKVSALLHGNKQTDDTNHLS
jgi:hypothetical protein